MLDVHSDEGSRDDRVLGELISLGLGGLQMQKL